MNMNRVENIRGPSYEEKGKKGKKGRALTLETETTKPLMRSRDLGEELLPGIQNYITLHMVSPMLSWGDLARLSTVSPGWQEAVESRLVYNERVSSHSTESLAVVTLSRGDDSEDSCDYCDSCRDRIFLYSMKDESWYELPLPEEILIVVKCVALDSKLYVIGGDHRFYWSAEDVAVYVLDLAGERQWKQCASPQDIYGGCLATVMHGKIYAFGSYAFICGVYDPKVDAWSYLMFTLNILNFPLVGTQIVTSGEEIFLERRGMEGAEVYHPESGLWRRIKDFQLKRPKGVTFSTQGKLLVLNSDGIFGLDIDEQSWILLQSCSFPFPQPRLGFLIDCLAVGHELVALEKVNCDSPRKSSTISQQDIFLQSCGFGQENKEIVWEIVAIPGDDPRTYMTVFHPRFSMLSIGQCSIQL